MADELGAAFPIGDRLVQPKSAGSVVLGLIPAPDIPEKIATELASELPELLAKRIDGSVSWKVPVLEDPLTGTDREAPEILDECRQRMLGKGWDLAVCLTDLPVYRAGTVTLGLIPAPDIPEKIAWELASKLPELLRNRVDGDVSWEVAVVVDPLTGTDREAPEILDVCRERRHSEGWDLALYLTDLPVYRSGTLVVADVSAKRGVAGLSLPALGTIRLRPKAQELSLQLVQELYEKTKEPGADDLPAP